MSKPPRIRLIPLNQAVADDLADPPKFARLYEASLGEYAELARQVAKQNSDFRGELAHLEWGAYLVADPATSLIVGTCAFKGPPTWDGTVEIAYFTFPAFERHGYATAMAASLIDVALEHAKASNAVRTICAHTLPVPNASTRILQRNGFTHVGNGMDPDEGPVWRWERRVEG